MKAETLVERYGYTPEQAEKEAARWNCQHVWGKWEQRTFMGCSRSCTKCGQKMADPAHCSKNCHEPSCIGGDRGPCNCAVSRTTSAKDPP